MAVERNDGIRFRQIPSGDLIDPFNSQTEWPRLSCPQANQLALEFGELSIDKIQPIKTSEMYPTMNHLSHLIPSFLFCLYNYVTFFTLMRRDGYDSL